MATGVIVRHSRTCATQQNKNARCNCKPSYRAEIYDRRSGKKLRKTFRSLDEAKGWRHDTGSGLRKGTVQAPTRRTLNDAAEAWLAGAKRRHGPNALRGSVQAICDPKL